ncbi:hypothetical protein NOV72_01373 [Caballeronia novacaledonica]|uniref:DUF3240 domain-containing protein n=1 Tax=Caballeronia novacaledonica TaxID=1544861 RepID=A0A2U3I1X7_9BURK|nr:DUF3240 family protein [Caballeronia novacaledonica]SPB14124.1 hypothetical protein NOV72_01373 [Caballeronia novacaledonica]
MDEYCLTIICPPTVEERLLDTLLATPGCDLFTSTPTHSHGMAPARLALAEQVMGRSRAIQVQVLLNKTELDELNALLKNSFAGVGLRYWAIPVTINGELA